MMSEAGITDSVSRRSFLAWTGAVGAGTALVATNTFSGMPGVGNTNAAHAQDSPETAGGDKIVWSACTVNCGSRCPVRLVVKDDKITRVLADNTGTDEIGSQQIRACVRGRAIRHRIYNPDRLKTPLKRVPGTERGAGQWEEISWDQALDEIADKMKEILDKYGNEAIYPQYGTGVIGSVIADSYGPQGTAFGRMMSLLGGYLNFYADYSTAQITAAYPYFYGEWTSSNSFDDVRNARLQVMFGNNPLETRMSGGGETMITQKIKQDYGVKTIVIDPRESETAIALGDEWVGLRPGTDAALVAGLAHVLITEDLHDQEFLDKYCVGFDESTLPEEAAPKSDYRSYIMGEGPDGVEKTPEWAARITGVPAMKIRQLAREMGTAKPVAITQGWGPQRQANGENQARAVFTLACLLGSPGVEGGGTGGREGSASLPMVYPFNEQYENPVKTSIAVAKWTEAVERGEEMTATADGVQGKDKLDVPIKMIWAHGSNATTNQHSDVNRTLELLKDESKLELLVVSDIQMTTSAQMADYVLPDASTAEQEDLIRQGSAGNMEYAIFASEAIKPLYECRPVYDVIADLADRLGVGEEFREGRTQQEWVKYTLDESRKEIPELPSYEQFKEQGIFRRTGDSVISLKDFREDPEANPLPTPSGKIEIYSQQLADLAEEWEFDDNLRGDKITALPEHVDTWEGALEAKENDQYPLQAIGHHFKGRVHSSYANVDWLRDDAHPQRLWINSADAAARGIGNGDEVMVFNDRGRSRMKARVTPRIVPGTVSIPQGAWYQIQEDGVDVGGSTNMLTSWNTSPLGKGNAQHTMLVQVEKA